MLYSQPMLSLAPISFHCYQNTLNSCTQIGFHVSNRHSNDSVSQTMSPLLGFGSSPCMYDSNFLKNPQQAQNFSFYFHKSPMDPLPPETYIHTQTHAQTTHRTVTCNYISSKSMIYSRVKSPAGTQGKLRVIFLLNHPYSLHLFIPFFTDINTF